MAERTTFTTTRLSPHLQTNIAAIERFRGVEFRIRDAKGLVTVAL